MPCYRRRSDRLGSRAGREVVVVEAQGSVGSETSSRNSEVIHAGIYYPSGSLKAQLCVEGNAALYNFCHEKEITHRRIEKLIVASSKAEKAILEKYLTQGQRNGVEGLCLLSKEEVSRLEPNLNVEAALLSQTTGIIDACGFMRQLQGDLQKQRGEVVFKTPVIADDVTLLKPRVELGDISKMSLQCNWVINAVGLYGPSVAAAMGQATHTIPKPYYAKGHYFSYSKSSPFKRLIYPVASSGGLGIHLTVDLGGQVRFGPDISWVDNIDYSFDESRKGVFIDCIRRYFPELDEGALRSSYTGIRPKLSAPGEPAADFLIKDYCQHDCPRLINLFGIESPGLTASLAIAGKVKSIINYYINPIS